MAEARRSSTVIPGSDFGAGCIRLSAPTVAIMGTVFQSTTAWRNRSRWATAGPAPDSPVRLATVARSRLRFGWGAFVIFTHAGRRRGRGRFFDGRFATLETAPSAGLLHLEQRILGAGDAQGAAWAEPLLGFIEREQHFGRTVSPVDFMGSCWAKPKRCPAVQTGPFALGGKRAAAEWRRLFDRPVPAIHRATRARRGGCAVRSGWNGQRQISPAAAKVGIPPSRFCRSSSHTPGTGGVACGVIDRPVV